jgi:tRNA threonylcarbamoyladenosine biosynthesis protein TsaE
VTAVDMHVRRATVADAPAMCRLIWAAFGARPPLDPPAPALAETPDSVGAEINARGGLVAREPGGPVIGCLLFGSGPGLRLTRVCTDPAVRHHGVAGVLVEQAEWLAARRATELVSLVARRELTENVTFWQGLGYRPVPPELFAEHDRLPHNLHLAKAAPVWREIDGPEAMRELGTRLAGILRAGDLVVLTGELGAGKTTLTQGIGAGLGVRGRVTSPTFVIARQHPGAVPLVHVDGYRLSGPDELADLDLETPAADAVTVVEWGRGLAEGLAPERLEISLDTPAPDDPRWARAARSGTSADDAEDTGAEPRTVTVRAVGGGWALRGLRALRKP